METLRKRRDFLKVATAGRAVRPGFVLQGRRKAPDEPQTTRVGFTVTKKIGNAVTRNRLRRRLRAVARSIVPHGGRTGWDYVFIGRKQGLERPYALMLDDCKSALQALHKHAETGQDQGCAAGSGHKPST